MCNILELPKTDKKKIFEFIGQIIQGKTSLSYLSWRLTNAQKRVKSPDATDYQTNKGGWFF